MVKNLSALLCAVVLTVLLGPPAAQAQTEPKPVRVLSLEIEAGISPAQAELLDQALEAAVDKDCGLVLIRLDTPGGLVTSMRDMVKSILASPVPVAVWVGPAGARAASAGTFLVAAAHFAGMSRAAGIGAASPVGIGGKDVPDTAARKAKNDLLALVRGVAQTRGRNADWYEKAVEEAASLNGAEAKEENVIDFLAEDRAEFLEAIGQRGLNPDGSRTFALADVHYVEYEPGFRYTLLSWLLDPQIAYFLLLGGMAGIFFELLSPGAVFPGVVGGLCLLMGLYAVAVLPTNVAGLLLLALGGVFFVMEAHITSFGLLGLAGVAALFVGSTILFPDSGGGSALPLSTIIPTVAALSLLLAGVMYLVAKAHVRKPSGGLSALVGLPATVVRWEGPSGQVLVRGELWAARSSAALVRGEAVTVTAAEGLVLTVAKSSSGEADRG